MGRGGQTGAVLPRPLPLSWVPTYCSQWQPPPPPHHPMEAPSSSQKDEPVLHPNGNLVCTHLPTSSPFCPHLSLTQALRTTFPWIPLLSSVGLGARRADREELGSRSRQVGAKS